MITIALTFMHIVCFIYIVISSIIYLQCDRNVALNSFFNQLHHSPTKVGWVGSGCSLATEPTAELTQFINITQVYYVVTDEFITLIYMHAAAPDMNS